MAAPLALVARKNTMFCHTPLSTDEQNTVNNILSTDPNCDILIAPNHRIDDEGIFRGFRVAFAPLTPSVVLPINREMFYGHAMIESSSSESVNPDVLRLCSDIPKCKLLMASLLQEIEDESKGNEVNLNCTPQNVHDLETLESMRRSGRLYTSNNMSKDSAPWRPEIPVQIGVYHAFVRTYSKDCREHRIFIAVTGGCTLAAETYYNLLLDVSEKVTVDLIADSEETNWLRQASNRARCRLLAKTAKKFELNIRTIEDINSYDKQVLALCSTDTLYNNISRLRGGHIAVFSDCVDTTNSNNGIINNMHPGEGLWVFKGPQRNNCPFGTGFGDQVLTVAPVLHASFVNQLSL